MIFLSFQCGRNDKCCFNAQVHLPNVSSSYTEATPATNTAMECPPSVANTAVGSATLAASDIYKKLLQSHHGTLTITAAVGCVLLLLSDPRGTVGLRGTSSIEDLAEVGSCSSSEHGHRFRSKHALVDRVTQHLHLFHHSERPFVAGIRI